MDVTKSLSWQELLAHKKRLDTVSLNQLFTENPARFADFSLEACGLLYDFSKQRIDAATLQTLQQLAVECDLAAKIQDLFNGRHVNKTENRPALHMQLRLPNPPQELAQTKARLDDFVAAVNDKTYLGITDLPIQHVLSLGIGGSDLGPLMACEALKGYRTSQIKLHFVSNVDGATLQSVLAELPPAATICLINSKTFVTSETMLNAKLVKAWFIKHLGEASIARHMFATTPKPNLAKEFGIAENNIFPFWDFVGGRYSLWSAVGLPLQLMLGTAQFNEFLAGAAAVDQHFASQRFSHNLPVLMALIGIWNINFLELGTLLVTPYIDSMQYFPAYLQQLEMESNGKRALDGGGFANYQTAPVIWGGVGCNGQHAYMQLLHQSPITIPVDFIAAVNSQATLQEPQDLLLASCLSQSKALLQGTDNAALAAKFDSTIAAAKSCPGNRPTSTIMFPALTPKVLGSLIALYEHKVFVQGVIWQIQSFDQWGVELGKNIIKDLLPTLHSEAMPDVDSSTAGLLHYIRRHRHD